MKTYQVCTNCVMDTSDPSITFDEYGVCDHCNDFYASVRPRWHPNHYGKILAKGICDQIKKSSSKNSFNCILGLSGGLDSSYLLHLAVKEFGLRPLVFHVDAGWNTDVSTSNIENIVNKLNLDLYTEVIEWDAVRDFQLALFKSGTPYLDLAQDHAFFATMYNFAERYNIKWILNGGNISTEGIRNPKSLYYYGTDMSFINDIRNRFCTTPMTGYPWSSIYKHKIYLKYIRRINVFRMLNYHPYNKQLAINELSHTYGFKPYPQKHFESVFTRYFESYWLPTRFGFDPRRVQLSSLIVTEQLSRQDAINQLKQPSFDSSSIGLDSEYIADKLGISTSELNSYHKLPLKYYTDYRNESKVFDVGARLLKKVGLEYAIKR